MTRLLELANWQTSQRKSRIANAGQSWPWEWKALLGKLWEKLSKWAGDVKGWHHDDKMFPCQVLLLKVLSQQFVRWFSRLFLIIFQRSYWCGQQNTWMLQREEFFGQTRTTKRKQGFHPVNQRVPVFLPLKTMMMGGMGPGVHDPWVKRCQVSLLYPNLWPHLVWPVRLWVSTFWQLKIRDKFPSHVFLAATEL